MVIVLSLKKTMIIVLSKRTGRRSNTLLRCFKLCEIIGMHSNILQDSANSIYNSAIFGAFRICLMINSPVQDFQWNIIRKHFFRITTINFFTIPGMSS